jgi:hypothetical protein
VQLTDCIHTSLQFLAVLPGADHQPVALLPCIALHCQVLIFNLLPPPGSPPLQPDERGAAWSPAPLAEEVQAQVVDAMERVSGGAAAGGRSIRAAVKRQTKQLLILLWG